MNAMAVALIDRLPHHCHIVNIRRNSYRMRQHRGLWQTLNSPEGGGGPLAGHAADRLWYDACCGLGDGDVALPLRMVDSRFGNVS